VSDVRGLVGIDARVLNQHFARRNFFSWFLIGRQRGRHLGPIQPHIDVSSAGNFEFVETRHRPNPGDDLFGNLAGSLAEFAGKFKRNRERVFSELNLGGLLDDDAGQIEAIGALQKFAQSFVQPAFQVSVQESL
jgi:hypothetical protein